MLLNKMILKYKKLINISFYYIAPVKQEDIHHLKNKKCTYIESRYLKQMD